MGGIGGREESSGGGWREVSVAEQEMRLLGGCGGLVSGSDRVGCVASSGVSCEAVSSMGEGSMSFIPSFSSELASF